MNGENMKYYIINGIIDDIANLKIDKNKREVYEVIRFEYGIALFIENHYQRFKNTFSLIGLDIISFEEFYKNIMLLKSKNNFLEGNIRISFYEGNYIYTYMNNSYITKEMVKEGVKVNFYKAVRENAHAKIMNNKMRDITDKIIANKNIYEVLLVDNDGFITEGSRTNFFAIKNHQLISPPKKDVLPGVTRRNLLEIAKNINIEITEEKIRYEEVDMYDGLVLTGTTTRILPISYIKDKFVNSKENKFIKDLILKYDRKISRYIDSKKN